MLVYYIYKMYSKNCVNFEINNPVINFTQNATGQIIKYVLLKVAPYITCETVQDHYVVCGPLSILMKEFARWKHAR